MKLKLVCAALFGILFLSLTYSAICQQEAGRGVEDMPEAAPMAEDISWVWGEVKALDSTTSSLTVIYMDYQTDEEKELILSTDSLTKFEGVGDFSGIKAGDTASIDYIVKDGKNIARNISIEKMEAMPEASVQAEDAAEEPFPAPKAE